MTSQGHCAPPVPHPQFLLSLTVLLALPHLPMLCPPPGTGRNQSDTLCVPGRFPHIRVCWGDPEVVQEGLGLWNALSERQGRGAG